MSDEQNDTQPNPAMDKTQPNMPAAGGLKPNTPLAGQMSGEGKLPNPDQPEATKKFPRWLVALVIVVLIIVGLLGGYSSGMGQRFAAQNTVISGQLADQFQLGTQAMQAGNLGLAKQYFEYVIRINPQFPGIQAAYTDLLIKMQVSPTPIFSPTPLISPTPDLRGAEEIFNTVVQLLNSQDWDGALTNLDSLRKEAPTYKTAEVDGMYYQALRQRGVAKITAACRDTNLEGGIYDLTLAEHFVGTGNLDSIAQSLRTYARLYIIGASFWDQDWIQAQYFFGQVMAGYPNMSDSSCLPAAKRWYEATINYAQQLSGGGKIL